MPQIKSTATRAVSSTLHLRGIVEEALRDQLVATPRLQRNFLHHPWRTVVLRRKGKAPMDRRVIAIDEDRAEPRGLDPGDGREHCAFAGGKRLATPARIVLVL